MQNGIELRNSTNTALGFQRYLVTKQNNAHKKQEMDKTTKVLILQCHHALFGHKHYFIPQKALLQVALYPSNAIYLYINVLSGHLNTFMLYSTVDVHLSFCVA